MSLKEHIWVWKTIAKISSISFLAMFGMAYLFRDFSDDQVEMLKEFGTIFLALLFGAFFLYMRFHKEVTSEVLADPKMVSRVVVQMGGVLHGKTSMNQEELERDAIGFLSKKYASLESLIEDGEFAFETKVGNSFDFLFEFLEIYDLSGRRVQTLTLIKGDGRQMKFASQVPKGIKIDWEVERIGRG